MNIGITSINATGGSTKKRILFFCALFYYAVVNIGTAADSPLKNSHISEHLFGLYGLSNVGRVTPDIYRGAQPQPEGYSTLKKMGIRTIINLRTTLSEKKKVEAIGMRSMEFPLSVIRDVDPKPVNKIISIMNDPDAQPVYIHCRQGQDRHYHCGIQDESRRMVI